MFDLVNNIEVLDNDIEEVEHLGLTFIRGVNSPKEEIEDSPFKIQAEIVDIVEYLKSITLDFSDRIDQLVEYYGKVSRILNRINRYYPLEYSQQVLLIVAFGQYHPY